MSLSSFHPAVRAWFDASFRGPTAAQAAAWPAIADGGHALIAAPTGSGKTLAAFLAAIDALVKEGVEGRLEDATRVASQAAALAQEQGQADLGEQIRARLALYQEQRAYAEPPSAESA